jgi:hypothetical protein
MEKQAPAPNLGFDEWAQLPYRQFLIRPLDRQPRCFDERNTHDRRRPDSYSFEHIKALQAKRNGHPSHSQLQVSFLLHLTRLVS